MWPDDSVYHTFSGIIFDHCHFPLKAFKKGKPGHPAKLAMGDLVYAENIGAYSNASATWFNGFPPARVLHVNE